MTQHIVNISGGKDSTACYLLALQRGATFRAVMADTGNEHPVTIDYAERLAERHSHGASGDSLFHNPSRALRAFCWAVPKSGRFLP